jgi:hypothetical protein
MLVAFGLAVILQQGFIVIRTWPHVPSSAEKLMGLGASAVLLWPLLASRTLEAQSKYVLPAVEVSLWIVLFFCAIYSPEILQRSTVVTFRNVFLGAGGWGFSLAVLMILVFIVLVLPAPQHRVFLRFPLTTFCPLAFLLAYLREHAYRVGVTDSLSRMLIHIVPLAILLVSSAAASSAWAPRLAGSESRSKRLPKAQTPRARHDQHSPSECR